MLLYLYIYMARSQAEIFMIMKNTMSKCITKIQHHKKTWFEYFLFKKRDDISIYRDGKFLWLEKLIFHIASIIIETCINKSMIYHIENRAKCAHKKKNFNCKNKN